MYNLDKPFFFQFIDGAYNGTILQATFLSIVWPRKGKFLFPSASLYHLYQHTKSSMIKALYCFTFKKRISQPYIVGVFTCHICRFP